MDVDFVKVVADLGVAGAVVAFVLLIAYGLANSVLKDWKASQAEKREHELKQYNDEKAWRDEQQKKLNDRYQDLIRIQGQTESLNSQIMQSNELMAETIKQNSINLKLNAQKVDLQTKSIQDVNELINDVLISVEELRASALEESEETRNAIDKLTRSVEQVVVSYELIKDLLES